MDKPLLQVNNLVKHYPIQNSAFLERNKKVVHAVDDVSFSLYDGQTLGLVGESGCGKSTIARIAVGIETPTSGEVLYQGQKLESLKEIRTELQMVFQDPYASLNPKKRIRDILGDPLLHHHLVTKDNLDAYLTNLLEEVGLHAKALHKYPHEFSGGQRQRIVIAKALSLNPKVLICDEPVSALDNSIQAQILNLLKDLQKKKHLTYLFIAHGLGTVHYISQEVAVMYLGRIVEQGPTDEVFHQPLHPYAKMLIAAVPIANPDIRDRKAILSTGEVPSAIDLPKGCRFHERCPFATERCKTEEPTLDTYVSPSGKHRVACFYAKEDAQ